MREWWIALGERVIAHFGWTRHVRLEFAVKTKFRGMKDHLTIAEWQSLSQVFGACPDLEDFVQLKLRDLEWSAQGFSIGSDGDRARLVNQSQREVLLMFSNLPQTATAKVNEMLQAKAVPSLKGNDHVYP